MNGYIVAQIFETATMILLGLCFILIIIGSIYDIWITSRQKEIAIYTRRRQRNRPHITILLYTKNNATVVATSLESIAKNRYPHYDIVAVNNMSSDDTRRQLSEFKRTHPAVPLYIYTKRKANSVHAVLQQAYKKSHHGSIVITLPAGSILSKTFLKESVAHLAVLGGTREKVAVLVSQRLRSSQNLASILHSFSEASLNLMQKVFSMIKVGRLTTREGTVWPALYTRLDFVSKTSRTMHYVYDSTLTLQMSSTDHSLLTKKRSPKELARFYVYGSIVAAYVTYCLHMAATSENTALLLLGWLVIVVWFFAAVWSEDGSNVSNKLRLTFALPSLYFFMYALLVAEITTRFVVWSVKSVSIIIESIISFYAVSNYLIEE